jgi:hypothetical protein
MMLHCTLKGNVGTAVVGQILLNLSVTARAHRQDENRIQAKTLVAGSCGAMRRLGDDNSGRRVWQAAWTGISECLAA